MGAYLLIDALVKLLQAEHPTIEAVEFWGEPVWLGWLMYPVLVWGVVPAIFIGLKKIEQARQLHDKTLYADALMCRANWLSGVAGIVGVTGIALGWWWLDGVAAAAISLDILHDGFKYTGVAVTDLMDRVPRTVDDRQCESLPTRLETELKKLDWVKEAQVRLREHGHVFYGEAFIQPVDRRNLLARTRQAVATAHQVDWRLHELVVQLVSEPIDEVHETVGEGGDHPKEEEEGAKA
jgi:divalent metal cation (Fe/Co/Zn/Cd) transporter